MRCPSNWCAKTDAAVIDAWSDLVRSWSPCWLRSIRLDVPVVMVVSQAGLVALSVDRGIDELLLPTAGPAEVDTRFRLLVAQRASEL